MTENSPEQAATAAATTTVRRLLATAKNPRTLLGQATPSVVAYHAAYEAVRVYREVEDHLIARRDGAVVCPRCGWPPASEPFDVRGSR